MDGVSAQPQILSQPVGINLGERRGGSTPSLTSTSFSSDVISLIDDKVLLTAEKGAGLEITGAIFRGSNGNPTYRLTFTNRTGAYLDGFQLQFNKNAFRLSLQQQPRIASVGPGESRNCVLQLAFAGQGSGNFASPVLQVAVKSPQQNQAVFYFNDTVPLEAVLLPDGRMETSTFMKLWQVNAERVRQVPLACRKALTMCQEYCVKWMVLCFLGTRSLKLVSPRFTFSGKIFPCRNKNNGFHLIFPLIAPRKSYS